MMPRQPAPSERGANSGRSDVLGDESVVQRRAAAPSQSRRGFFVALAPLCDKALLYFFMEARMAANTIPSAKPRRTTKARRALVVADLPNIDTSITPQTCPLAFGWPARLRQMQFVFSDPAEKAGLIAAHQTELGATLATIAAVWLVAADDHSQETPAYDSHVTPGFPCHIHTEFAVAGQLVHVDRTWANLWGPGRLKAEWHIFVDGALAGFGGEMGCSLGLTIAIWPAVALLNDNRAIVVLRPPYSRSIALQQILGMPSPIELHSLGQSAT